MSDAPPPSTDAAPAAPSRGTAFARDAKVCLLIAAACMIAASTGAALLDYFATRSRAALADELAPFVILMACASLVIGFGGVVRAWQAGRATGWFERFAIGRWFFRLCPAWRWWRFPLLALLAVPCALGSFALLAEKAAAVASDRLNLNSANWRIRVVPDGGFEKLYRYQLDRSGGTLNLIRSADELSDRGWMSYRFCNWRAMEGRELRADGDPWNRDGLAAVEMFARAREVLTTRPAQTEAQKLAALDRVDAAWPRSSITWVYRKVLDRLAIAEDGARVYVGEHAERRADRFLHMYLYELDTRYLTNVIPARRAPPPAPWWVHARPWQAILFVLWMVLLFPFVFLRTPGKSASDP